MTDNIDENNNEDNTVENSAEESRHEENSKDTGQNKTNLETLLKVPVNLSIEVGRKQMLLNDILETREGTIVELERMLDEPLDILVNGALVAHGVVVLAKDRFGIQITDVVSIQERISKLGQL